MSMIIAVRIILWGGLKDVCLLGQARLGRPYTAQRADRIRIVYEGHEEVFRCIRSEK